MIPCEKRLEYLRHRMVEEQLLARGIKDRNLLRVFKKVPRHRFVDPALRTDAYGDFPLSIGKGQTISQPYMVALMVELLAVLKTDKILEIGTGSGYETAILAELGAEVYTIERISNLARKAQQLLEDMGYRNIHIKIADGTLGWEEEAPFNKIIVTASSPQIPEPLLGQLSCGGRMVIPIGPRFTQKLFLVERSIQGQVIESSHGSCVFVPLIGRYAWKDKDAGANN